MINVLLLEDNKEDRKIFVKKLKTNFDRNTHLLNPEYSENYKHIYQRVLKNLNETDLVIADIALTENINDTETWASQLLLDVLAELGDNAPVKRTGIALVFMTAHVQEQVQARIQLHHPSIFNTDYIYTNFVRKGYLAEDLQLVLNDFKQNFAMPQPDGRWYKNTMLHHFINDSLNAEYALENRLNGNFRITGRNIVSIRYNDGYNDEATLYYLNEAGALEDRAIAIGVDRIIQLLQVYTINAPRAIDNNFLLAQHSIGFLQIANRPFALINPHIGNWYYAPRQNRAVGRDLSIRINGRTHYITSTIRTLYEFFDMHPNFNPE